MLRILHVRVQARHVLAAARLCIRAWHLHKWVATALRRARVVPPDEHLFALA